MKRLPSRLTRALALLGPQREAAKLALALSAISCATLALPACASQQSSFVKSDTTLGRVVIYRNGVAYFERSATIDTNSLNLTVPSDKVDDFLKSLTVVDAQSGQPAPISYPTTASESGSAVVEMKIQLGGTAPHHLRLSYVTEAPAWKPSYRIVLGDKGKVTLQAWAIVDNTSGEDWQAVELGVGASSALSFRYNLRAVRLVQRETLRSDDLFAQAPPTGGATYGASTPGGAVELSDEILSQALASNQSPAREEPDKKSKGRDKAAAPPPPPAANRGGGVGHGAPAAAQADYSNYRNAQMPQPAVQQTNQLDTVASNLRNTRNQVVVEGFADASDGDKQAASLERANRVREQLVRNGLAPDQVVAVGRGEQAGRKGGVRVLQTPPAGPTTTAPADKDEKAPTGEPIGTVQFDSGKPMNVPRGSSAMVSILNTQADGEVVYFYDAESPRGNATFPFRAVRIRNPTSSALESGPVTVFGAGRFIGEGLSEPIPAKSVAFIPFALDRQVLVERKDAEQDKIARILTVQRGVFSTETQHTLKTTFTLHNRMNEPATVYVRHTVHQGYTLDNAPKEEEMLGQAHLFRVQLAASAKAELVIEESSPVYKTVDVRSSAGMELVRVYLSSAALEGPLKEAVGQLLQLHKDMANYEQQIATKREQMEEYRARMDELHAQIVTLKAVKTAGPLMQSLEKKLQEVSDKLSKATIDLVGLQEKLMVSRIRFQDGVADLSLEHKAQEEKKDSAPKP